MEHVLTEMYYQAKIDYDVYVAKKHSRSQLIITAVNDLLYIYTECNGKSYEKLKRLPHRKTKSPDDVCNDAVLKEYDSISKWIKKGPVNGIDLNRHGLYANKTYNGYSLGGYFERVLENPGMFYRQKRQNISKKHVKNLDYGGRYCNVKIQGKPNGKSELMVRKGDNDESKRYQETCKGDQDGQLSSFP